MFIRFIKDLATFYSFFFYLKPLIFVIKHLFNDNLYVYHTNGLQTTLSLKKSFTSGGMASHVK